MEGAEELGWRPRGDLHLSFWSVSGTGDGELVQSAGVPVHLVDDEHLQGTRRAHRCLALPGPKAVCPEARPRLLPSLRPATSLPSPCVLLRPLLPRWQSLSLFCVSALKTKVPAATLAAPLRPSVKSGVMGTAAASPPLARGPSTAPAPCGQI